MLNKINDIHLALANKSYLSALALALTLPDICGEIEYPDLTNKNGYREVRKQYAAWFDDWVNQYFADDTGWTDGYNKAKNPYFTGEMCYSLRCSFLHSGNARIKDWGNSEDKEFYYSYEFRLTIGGADSHGVSWPYYPNNDSKVQKNRIVSINVEKLCDSICRAAERYYQEKDPKLFRDNHIHLINLS